MSEVWAKRNGVLLREHIYDILKVVENKNFPWEKLKIEDHPKLKKLLKYAIVFHDFGKVSPEFQINKVKNTKFKYNIPEFPPIRHNILSIFFIEKSRLSEICENRENLYATLLSAIAFHHWRKDEKEYLLNINPVLINTSKILLKKYKNGKSIGDLLSEELKCHFENFKIDGEYVKDFVTFDEHLAKHISRGGEIISGDIIPPYSLYFLPERKRLVTEKEIDLKLWIYLCGLLIRADHFASFIEEENKKSWIQIFEKQSPYSNVIKKLKEKHNLKDSIWQEKELCNEIKNKNIILIAPTGLGKTEFAFAWAEGNKFFYTLPLRVATNQIFDRVCEYFNKKQRGTNNKDTDPYIKENVGLLHSDADLYLLEKSGIEDDTAYEGENLKILDLARHLSLPVNICTGDQIFPAALKYPGYEKIYATLGYSKLIIDEVQAYDPKACAIVVTLIKEIVSLGGKFLLMTATLPDFVKEEIESFLEKEDYKEINVYEKSNVIKNITRHKVEIREKDIEESVEEILERTKKGKRVLVILNTVKKAEEIYKKLKDLKEKRGINNIKLNLLHSKFTLNKRREKEQEIEKIFKNPKPFNEKEGKILVATQVVEASLDIDADYLFTELCPMDSLIQRMGRVMRRVDLITGKIKSSDKDFKYKDFYSLNEANVIIFVKHNENNREYFESGKGKVYNKEILEFTLKILKDKKGNNKVIAIPEKEKNKWVCKVYKNLDQKSSYLREFYETLEILRGGYVSENKEEAHKLFRKIYTLPVINEVDKENEETVIQKIAKKINSQKKISWLWFKKEIIAKFVINENMWELRNKLIETLWDSIESDLKNLDRENNRRLENYCRGIWVVKDKNQNII